VTGTAFSDDGTALHSAGLDHSVIGWDLTGTHGLVRGVRRSTWRTPVTQTLSADASLAVSILGGGGAEAASRRRSIRRLRTLALGLAASLAVGVVAIQQRNDATRSSLRVDVRALSARPHRPAAGPCSPERGPGATLRSFAVHWQTAGLARDVR
jgi:hypothetical protein